jgi:hypothetical protein
MLPSVCAGAQVSADLTTLAVASMRAARQPHRSRLLLSCRRRWSAAVEVAAPCPRLAVVPAAAAQSAVVQSARSPRRRAAQTPTRGSAVGGAVVGTVITAPPASAPLLTTQPPHAAASAPAACTTALLSAAIAIGSPTASESAWCRPELTSTVTVDDSLYSCLYVVYVHVCTC